MALTYNEVSTIFNLHDKQSITKNDIDEIIMALQDPMGVDHYYFLHAIKAVREHISKDQLLTITNTFLNSHRNYIVQSNFLYLYEQYDHDEFVKLFEASKLSNNKNIYLALKKYTLEQEVLALRSITGVSKIWPQVYKNKYKMSKEAIEKLPPIMRLKVLEFFVAENFISYNIFENIRPDDFKALLFGSSFRYNEKANDVWNRYDELCKFSNSKNSIINYKFDCPTCGDTEVKIDSKMLVSKRILEGSRIHNSLNVKNCPICGKWGAEGVCIVESAE